jgi:hypothetical protein
MSTCNGQLPVIYNRRRYNIYNKRLRYDAHGQPYFQVNQHPHLIEQIIYKYVQHTTGFFLVQSKYYYIRNLGDLHVWIIIEHDGQSILFPVPKDYISLIDDIEQRREIIAPRRSSEILASRELGRYIEEEEVDRHASEYF